MAGWTQTPGGQVVWTDSLELVTTEDEAELITGEDAGGWHGFQVAKTASVGEWTQDATWEAALSEDLEGSAGWSQSASWDAAALSAEDVSAEATFEQTAAWDATATHAEVEPITSTGEWEQTAAWSATADHAADTPQPPASAARITGPAIRRIPRPPQVAVAASWGQAPATWTAHLVVDASLVELEELVLAGAI